MREIASIQNRAIWYSNNPNEILYHHLKNWLFLPILDDLTLDELDKIAMSALSNQAIYACCLGKQAEKLHDIIDENQNLIELGIIEGKLPEITMLTTWHHDFEEGIWFSIFAANHLDMLIENIFCLDLSIGTEKRFLEIIYNLENNYLRGNDS